MDCKSTSSSIPTSTFNPSLKSQEDESVSSSSSQSSPINERNQALPNKFNSNQSTTHTLPNPFPISHLNMENEIKDLKIQLSRTQDQLASSKLMLKPLDLIKTELDKQITSNTVVTNRLVQTQSLLKQAQASQLDLNTNIQHIKELEDIIEILTLDKDLADELLEDQIEENDRLIEVYDRLLEDYKQLSNNTSTVHHHTLTNQQLTPNNNLQDDTLLQNTRLKQALLSLKHILNDTEQKLESLQIPLEKNQSLLNQNEMLKIKIENNESIIEELREALDDALGSEELIHILTEKNFSLSDKCDELGNCVEDLLVLKGVNDEIEESHLESEQMLLKELESNQNYINQLRIRYECEEEKYLDYQRTIYNYRDLVDKLNKDMSILTDALKDNVFKSNERDQRIIDGLNVSNQVLKESNRKLRIDSMVVLGKLNSIQFESSITKMFIGNGFKEEETKIECIKMMMTWSIQIDPQCDWHVQYNQLCFQSLSESLLQSSKTMYGYLKVCQYKDEIQRINVSYLQYLEDYRDGTLTNLSSSIVKLQTIAKELESDRTSHVIVNGLIEQIEFMVTRQSTLSHLSKLDLPSYSAKTSVLCVSVKRLLKSVTGIEKVIYPKSIVDLVEQSHAYVTMCQCFMDAFMKKTDSLERNDLFTETLIELSLKTSQDYLARGETVFMGGIIEVFCIIETLCDEATTMLLDASLEKVEKEVSVFELRAQTYQSDKTRQIDLRSHLQSLKETNSELCEEIRLKDMKLDEMDVKLFIVESKMSSQTQQDPQTIALIAELDELKKSESLYKQAVESLHADLEEVEEENEQHKSHIQSLIKQTPTKFKADHVSLSDGLSEKVFYLTEIVHFLNKENTRLKRVRYVEMGVRLMDEDDLMRVTKSRRLDIHKSSKTECALLVRDVHEALCRPKLIDLTSLYKSKIGRKSLLSRNMSKELEQSSLLARSRHLLESTLVQC